MSEGKSQVVIAVDFGTTYSGFAYAHRSKPEEVLIFENWPSYGEAGGGYKTHTSLFYTPTAHDGSLELHEWGWPALVAYVNALDDARALGKSQQSFKTHGEIASVTDVKNKVSYFITKFKLFLAPGRVTPELPAGLSVERLVTDYLKAISEFAVNELRFKKSDVQWCVTVPAIWDEAGKQKMVVYAEKAGMVKGKNCTDPNASPYPLAIVLEPEAASMYSQKQLQHLKAGERFLVVDIGGGTIDLALHEKADDHSLQVNEANMNTGSLGGGTFVDEHFKKLICKKIPCFNSYSTENPKFAMELMNWWLARKCSFDGSSFVNMTWDVPGHFCRAWKKYDTQQQGTAKEEEMYDIMVLEPPEVQSVFKPEIDKVIELIDKQLKSISEVKCILIVGGFSENKYLVKCIRNKFQIEVVVPSVAGSAVVHGAVVLGFQSNLVLSRMCKKSYGIHAKLLFRGELDPEEYLERTVSCSGFLYP